MFKWETKKVYNALIQLGDADDSGKGKHFKSRFFKDGLVKVEPFGTVFIKKENLDKYINTMVGVPVIINHKDLTDENVNDERVGVVNSVWYNEEDGWYWCDGIIWDETAQNLITDKGWSVSCSYDVKVANDEGGSENNIKYDIEFLDAVFTHLALVNNPRYERANIVFNSKTVIENGGQGSGNFGHAGRIGEVGGSSTNAPQNVDINTLKPVEYTEDDVKRFEQDGSIKEFYKSYIQKGTVTHPELGEIKLVEKGLTETINKNRHRNMYLLGKIPQLIESAQYDRPEELTHPREDGINKFHYLYAKAQRGTKSKIVLIKIAEDNQGNKFFILKPVQTIKNSSESLSQLSHNGSQGASETIFIINIIKVKFGL